MTPLEQLKALTGEDDPDFRMYADEKLQAILDQHGGNVKAAAYDILIRKAQPTATTLAGVSLPDMAPYWLRRAAMVRPNKSGNAPRADDPPIRG